MSSTSSQEDILSLIFEKGCNEEWKDDTNIHSYLSELSTFGVQRLSNEPSKLSEDKSILLEQIQDLAFNNYKTFIEAAHCSQKIVNEFDIIEGKLDSLLNTIPTFEIQCNEFESKSREIGLKWSEASLTLSKYPQLLEILELPQLMETCVRNGQYEEAMELSIYINKLHKKHGSIPLIASISKDIEAALQMMLNQLLGQLCSNIQLASCMKVIGFLRRMDVYTDLELRIKFLQMRDIWFSNLLKSVPRVDGYSHITKIMDLTRVHLFDIITQYRATFSDEETLILSKIAKSNVSTILPSWVSLKIDQFLKTLEDDLNLPDVAEKIGAVMGGAMFFGLSCSRVGADIRPLMVPLFLKAIYGTFNRTLDQANGKFSKSMETFTLTSASFHFSTLSLNVSETIQTSGSTPLGLLEFPPLAHYCNDILMALNILRLCAPLSLASKITETLQISLIYVSQTILEFYKSEELTLTEKEQDIFSKMCNQFVSELIPHFQSCLDIIYPPIKIAKMLGLTHAEYNKVGIGKLNSVVIIKPIEHLFIQGDDEASGITISPGESKEVEVEEPKLNDIDSSPQHKENESLGEENCLSPKPNDLQTDIEVETSPLEKETLVESTNTLEADDVDNVDNDEPENQTLVEEPTPEI